MAYQYHMIQIPPQIDLQGVEGGTEAAAYLEQLVNKQAQQGWEFYRVDPVGVQVNPGCLGGLIGQKAESHAYYVVTFRREGSAPTAAPR